MTFSSTLDHALEIGFRLAVWIMFLWLDTWTPFIRHIDEDEMNLYRYPSLHSYVSKRMLYCLMFGMPALIYLVLYLLKRDENTIEDIKRQIYGISMAYTLTATFTTVIKIMVGRPRPNFFLRCFPDGYGTNIDSCTGEYEGHMDGRKSFPSAHASFTFTGMVYLTLYLFNLIDFRKPFAGRGPAFFLSTMPLLVAIMIAVSRTCDYHHHYSDVIGGGMLGSAIGIGVFYYYGTDDETKK